MNLKVPVLMYHGISADNHTELKSPYYMTRSQFQAQMKYLQQNNFKTLSLGELVNISKGDLENSDRDFNKLIVITFDDGYQNNYDIAFQILKRYSLTATFFVIANRMGTPDYLSWEQLNQMTIEGMEIQSHTYSHQPLGTLTLPQVEQELLVSKQVLEQNISKSITFVSYPHGSYNSETIEIAKKLGYKGSCTSEIAFFNNRTNPFEIGRFDIRKNYDLEDFIKIISKDLSFIKKLRSRKAFKQVIQRTIGITNYNRLYKTLHKMNYAEA